MITIRARLAAFVVMALILPGVCLAQVNDTTEQLFQRRVRINWKPPLPAAPDSIPALDVWGAAWFRLDTHHNPRCAPTNGGLCNSPILYFEYQYDSDATAGISWDTISVPISLVRDTSGSPRLNLGSWFRSFGGYFEFDSFSGTPPVSPAFTARMYYNPLSGKLRASLGGGAYGDIVRTGDAGVVSSVALSMSPGTLYTVTGSPITTSGTLTATLNTQAANTAFRGPISGAAAQPTFRVMDIADIPAKLITFAKWNGNGCADQQIPKYTLATDTWACAIDATSVGGTSWVTGGNAGTGGTGNVGTTDAAGFNFLTNNIVRGGFSSDGAQFWSGIVTGSAPALAAAGQGRIYYNSTLQKFQQSTNNTAYIDMGGVSSVALAVPSGFTVTGSPVTSSGTITIARSTTTLWQWTPQQAIQPSTAFATLDTRNDHPVLDFSDGVSDSAYFQCRMPEEWDGTTVEVMIGFTGLTAATGNVRWEVTFERMEATDLDADSFGTPVLVTAATFTTSGQSANATTSHSTAATRDSVQAGDMMRIRIRRLGADAADTMTGEAQVYGVQLRRP